MRRLPDLRHADLSGMDLSGVYLDGCVGVTFERALMTDVDLSHSQLRHCGLNMQGAKLQRADFRDAWSSRESADASTSSVMGAPMPRLSAGSR